MSLRRAVAAALPAILAAVLMPPTASAHGNDGAAKAAHSLRGPVTDENFYFVMADRFENGNTANDTGGLTGDYLTTGFDPTRKGFYNGGDLKGLRDRIDYVRGLGTTSIWLTPSFKNKAVQLEDGPSAGYHGYWITDFTQIDPHLGTNADLQALVDAAHSRGMKVYFDIITNHTADVIGYDSDARKPYVSKDVAPYKTASGQPFDDRDYAETVGLSPREATGTNRFPPMSADTSFPPGYKPVLDPAEQNLKQPAWLNDVTLYHNRGDTTFVGENSQYGDFFGLDDLFTENPRVVQGMIDIYKTWIRDFKVDGFRIDTMKHVDDAFWQAFGPQVLQYAKSQGKREFFMFGEVFDTTKSFTSQYTTRNKMQSVLDFPFQDAARGFASKSGPTNSLGAFFQADDWYTDDDSNVYQLPTFLGNHDMGRIGSFVKADNPGASDAEYLARDRLAHELMYFARGNPVIYYGDEQGFTGPGGDQDARQTMFASRVPDYLDDDLLGTDATHAQSNFVPSHPLYRSINELAALTKQHPALRNGAHQDRYSTNGPGIYAFSRIDRGQQREYVVALNNSEQAATAAIPTYGKRANFKKIYGDGVSAVRTSGNGDLTLTVAPLSAVVYQATDRLDRSRTAPQITLDQPQAVAGSNGRMHVSAQVGGSSFSEVTFQARVGNGQWRSIGTDDTAPYQVYHDVSGIPSGGGVQYRAVVLDNAGHDRASAVKRATVPLPSLTIEVPAAGSNVRGTVEVRAVADPEKSSHVVRIDRSIAGGAWTPIGTDSSSPVYTVFDNLTPLNLATGTTVAYRAVLTSGGGQVTSAVREVRYAGPPLTSATLRYFRPDGNYADWGLHMWGDAVDPAVLAQISWGAPWQRASVDADGWAVYTIPLVSDTAPVNFIMHRPNGDAVPDTREPGGDRSFLPINSPGVWLVAGDPTVYTTNPR